MVVDTNKINGNITISTIHNGYRVKQVYIGHELTEAKRLFKTWLKSLR